MVSQQPIQLQRGGDALDAIMAAAGFEARRAVRSCALPDADRDDLEQTILLAVLVRAERFDAGRAQWSTFIALIARNAAVDFVRAQASRRRLFEPIRVAESELPDPKWPANPELSIDFRNTVERLPRPLQRLVVWVAEAGSVPGALRASGHPPASFYRQVRELRMRLRAAGLMPPREKISAPAP